MISRVVCNRRSLIGGAATAIVGALVLTACGGGSSSGSGSGGGSSTSPAAVAPSGGTGNGGGFGGANRPGTFGTIAAITGTTMQVQNQQSGQVAVSWTTSTKFTHQVKTTVAAVKAGDCITATAASGTTSSSSAPITATSVTVSAPVNGQCTGGAGGGPGGGARPSGFPSGGFPSGVPSGGFPSGFPGGGARPSDFPSGAAGRIGNFVTGTVTSVSGSTITVRARSFGSSDTTSHTIIADTKTTVDTTASTTSKSLKVGLCVTAQGKADSSGAVTATSVRISNPVSGNCTLGFGGRNG
jgi:hypothetical protein